MASSSSSLSSVSSASSALGNGAEVAVSSGGNQHPVATALSKVAAAMVQRARASGIRLSEEYVQSVLIPDPIDDMSFDEFKTDLLDSDFRKKPFLDPYFPENVGNLAQVTTCKYILSPVGERVDPAGRAERACDPSNRFYSGCIRSNSAAAA
jgi:hypothetical protein